MAMSKEKRQVIQANFTKLTENIGDIDTIVSSLFSAGVITASMEEDIKACRTRSNKIRALLTLLPKRGEAAFDKFYKALIDSEESVAAKLIESHVSDRSLIDNRLEIPVTNAQVNRNILPAVFPPDNEEEITVITYTDSNMTENYRKSLQVNNNEIYKNTNGLCLLLYNEDFEQTQFNDLNLEKDAQDLTELFEKLRFKVEPKRDFTKESLMRKLSTYTTRDLKNIDCLVVFVLTHGENGLVYGTDGIPVNVQSIIDYFYPASCPDLTSKPKLFFIQAASLDRKQGNDCLDGGKVEVSIKGALDKMNIGDQQSTDASAESRNMPSRGDTYVCYSATSDKAYPNQENSGSMFIQALIYAYKNYSYSDELNELTNKMNALIKKGELKNGRPATIGSHIKSSLNKSFYFFPRNP